MGLADVNGILLPVFFTPLSLCMNESTYMCVRVFFFFIFSSTFLGSSVKQNIITKESRKAIEKKKTKKIQTISTH